MVVEYGFDMVVVPVEVEVEVSVRALVSRVVSAGGGSLELVSGVVVAVVVVVVVVVVVRVVIVVVVVVVGRSVPDGAVEWREVCTTANTITATTTRPPTAAANTAPGCSYHWPSATGIDRRASR